MSLDKKYWDDRYKADDFPWDVGYVSPPLKDYFEKLSKKKDLRILIPGAGNAYEAEYLFRHGFKNVYVLDISPTAVKTFKARFPEFPAENIFTEDFFSYSGEYDLIVEQTFFCALDPALRSEYVKKMHGLLAQNGILAGLLFEDPALKGNPPFGGTKNEYLPLFKNHFKVLQFDLTNLSIQPRLGRELFFEVQKQ